MSGLQVRNFGCGYSDKAVVHNVDLEVTPGRMTVLLGPNGAGKTTLIRGMTRILKPMQGSVNIGNTDIWKLAPKVFSQHVARVAQSVEITWPFTVRDFTAMGRYPYVGFFNSIQQKDDDLIKYALSETGLTEFADRQITELSGGEFQRAMIARALAQESDILVLDEPVAHLDLHYKVAILEELKRICSKGKGLIISLHDLNFAAQYGDYIYLMQNGNVISDGTPAEVIQEKIISDIYGTAVSVKNVDGRIVVMPK